MRYKQASNTVSKQQADGSRSIIDLDCFDYNYQIDGWAAKYWSMLDGKRSQNEIIEELCNLSKLEQKFVEKQVKQVTTQLLKYRLLEKV